MRFKSQCCLPTANSKQSGNKSSFLLMQIRLNSYFNLHIWLSPTKHLVV